MSEGSQENAPPSTHVSIERQEANLARQLEWIRAVDGKLPIVIGLATAMLAVTAALTPTCWNWGVALLVVMGATPVTVLAFCAHATFPQTDGPAGSLIYFGSIAARPLKGYTADVLKRTDIEYLQDLNAQCHRNAQIATLKYRAVARAMLFLFITTPIWLIGCFLLHRG